MRRPTGAGPLDQYKDAPSNPAPGSEWGARIARGLEGLLGGAGLALWDLALGAAGYLRARARRPVAEGSPRVER